MTFDASPLGIVAVAIFAAVAIAFLWTGRRMVFCIQVVSVPVAAPGRTSRSLVAQAVWPPTQGHELAVAVVAATTAAAAEKADRVQATPVVVRGAGRVSSPSTVPLTSAPLSLMVPFPSRGSSEHEGALWL